MLAAQGRPTVPDVIIFETDGQANQPNTLQPCNYFNTKANAAKAAGQTIFTIAYGLDSPPVKCDFDTSGPFVGKYATYQPGRGGDGRRPTTSRRLRREREQGRRPLLLHPRHAPTSSRCSARWRPPRSRPRT